MYIKKKKKKKKTFTTITKFGKRNRIHTNMLKSKAELFPCKKLTLNSDTSFKVP